MLPREFQRLSPANSTGRCIFWLLGPLSLPPSDWRLNSWRDWDLCQRNAFQVALRESYQGRGTFVPNVFGLSFQSGVYGLFFSLGLGRRQCWREERASETLLLFNHSVMSDLLATLWTSVLCLRSPPGSSVHGDSPGKNTGVDCRFLLQGISPTQG